MKFEPKIEITFDDNDKKTLTISDTGIGMNAEDLDTQLGTIARSGTKNFLNSLSGDAKKDASLIGQFGVGFYSTFMVADRVEVLTKKAGEDQAWLWESDGQNAYTVKESEKESFGTTITLFLNEEGAEYASRWELESLIKKYSDHIAFPIFLEYDSTEYEGEGDDKKEKKVHKREQVNKASALWKQSKSSLTDEDYNEFYKTISHDSDDPLLYIHTKAEGTLEYTTLFYIPKKPPLTCTRRITSRV